MAAHRLCTIEGCSKRHYGRGWCKAHYERWRTCGDPLFPASRSVLLEWVLSHVTYSIDKCLTWPFHRHTKGYPGRLYAADGRKMFAHRLMCELAHGQPPTPKHEAAHSCGKGCLGCINPNHLSWKLHKENMNDRLIHGTHNRGSRNGHSIVNECEVLEIRSLKGKMSNQVIANKFGLSPRSVRNIFLRRTWDWLED